MSNSVEKLMSVLVAMGHWTGFGVSARYPGRVEIQLPKALIADPVMAGRSGGDFEGCTGESGALSGALQRTQRSLR